MQDSTTATTLETAVQQIQDQICSFTVFFSISHTLIQADPLMKNDKEKWNERYSTLEYPNEPSELVRDYYSLANMGSALDIASGNGRNSIFLASKGFEVDAIDISDFALTLAKRKNSGIQFIDEDLDFFRLKTNNYDLIININFLQRRLFPQIQDALKAGGILIFETFLEDNDKEEDETIKKDHYLKKNELLHSFLNMHIIFYQEKQVMAPIGELRDVASLVAIKKTDL